MKDLLFLFIFLLPFTQINKVVINDLHKIYYSERDLEFTIKNNYNENISYFVSVEINDGLWKEIVYTLFDSNSKSSLSKIIKANQKIKVQIPIKKIFYENQLHYKEYRLKIIYGNKVLNEVCYSAGFKIR